MGNMDFNKFQIFIQKCQKLQGYGYIFPTQVPNGELTFNDVDYDSNGELYVKIKTFDLYLILDINEHTHIPLGVYYKESDALKNKNTFLGKTIYKDHHYKVKESNKAIYENVLDDLILKEEDILLDKQNDFKIVYTEQEIANIFQLRLKNPLYGIESEAEEWLDVTEYEWVLIVYTQTGVEIITLYSDSNNSIFYYGNNSVMIDLNERPNSLFKVVVHRLLPPTMQNKSRIKYITFTN